MRLVLQESRNFLRSKCERALRFIAEALALDQRERARVCVCVCVCVCVRERERERDT